MFLLRLFVGVVLVMLGLGYLFHPESIINLNSFMRDNVFKDTYVLLSNRRIGSILLVIGFILLILTFQMPR